MKFTYSYKKKRCNLIRALKQAHGIKDKRDLFVVSDQVQIRDQTHMNHPRDNHLMNNKIGRFESKFQNIANYYPEKPNRSNHENYYQIPRTKEIHNDEFVQMKHDLLKKLQEVLLN